MYVTSLCYTYMVFGGPIDYIPVKHMLYSVHLF